MSKLESNAISAEVAGLFDTIRKQAHDYCRLMEQLEQRADAMTRLGDELRAEFGSLSEANSTTLRRVEETTETTLQTIREKSGDIERIHAELSNIEKTRDAILNANRDINARRSEIDKLLKTSEQRINQLVGDGFLDLEKKIALQVQQLREELHRLDQRQINLLDKHRRETKMIQNDIDEFKSKVTETKYIVDETTKIVEVMIDEANDEMERKIGSARREVEKMIMAVELPEHSSDADHGSRIQTLANENNELRRRLGTLQTRVSTLQFLAVGCGLGAIILSAIIAAYF